MAQMEISDSYQRAEAASKKEKEEEEFSLIERRRNKLKIFRLYKKGRSKKKTEEKEEEEKNSGPRRFDINKLKHSDGIRKCEEKKKVVRTEAASEEEREEEEFSLIERRKNKLKYSDYMKKDGCKKKEEKKEEKKDSPPWRSNINKLKHSDSIRKCEEKKKVVRTEAVSEEEKVEEEFSLIERRRNVLKYSDYIKKDRSKKKEEKEEEKKNDYMKKVDDSQFIKAYRLPYLNKKTEEEQEDGENVLNYLAWKEKEEEISLVWRDQTPFLNLLKEDGDEKGTDKERQESEWDLQTLRSLRVSHDFYCPNCKSCITHRIILQKRRRFKTSPSSPINEEVAVPSPKRNETETMAGEGEIDKFQCFSCFRLFIPTGSGLKVFRTYDADSFSTSTICADQLETPAKAQRSENEVDSLLQNPIKGPVAISMDDSLEERVDPETSGIKGLEVLKSTVYGGLTESITSLGIVTDNDEYGGRSMSLSTLSRMLSDDNDEEVKKLFLTVIHKFLNSSNFCCLNCNTYISDVLTGHAQELENMSIVKEQFPISASTKDQEEDRKLKGVVEARSTKMLDIGVGEELLLSRILCLLLTSRNFYCPKCNVCISKLIVEKLKRHWSITLEEEHGQSFSSNSCFSFISPGNKDSQQTSTKTHPQERGATNPEALAIIISSHLIGEPPKLSNGGKRWELVLQCMVSDGLFASITSLIVITSAATTNISNGSVVTFALTNLIAGLFIIRHNLGKILKKHGFKMGLGGMDVEDVTQYKEILKDRLLYLLYFIMAFLSFLLFGGVPPLIYGFIFQENDDKNLKLAAAAGASLLCITVLSILKAHLQKLQIWLAYVKTVAFYHCIGVVAFGLAYITGNLFRKLI